MGGRHTEEMGGNLSFQEFMFLPLTAQDYIEAQRVTNLLQNRAIQIIQDTEGLNFVGIGLEGGIVASYARGKDDILPEERALEGRRSGHSGMRLRPRPGCLPRD
jgi:enolase